MTYEVRVDVDAAESLNSKDEKTQSIIKENLGKLEEEPYPFSPLSSVRKSRKGNS